MSNDNSTVIGAVILARHGDRQGFYQDPNTYSASATAITPLGEQQEFDLGAFFRSLYLDPSSSSFIEGIANSSSLFQQSQVQVRADAGGEGGVIFDSSIALTQGLWQPTSLSTITLSNGTNVTSPLGGYQYVPIESVEPNEDVSLEGFTSCPALDEHTSNFYASAEFTAKAAESATFLNSLQPFMDGRAVTLQNMWNIFDYMNVQSIHNKTFNDTLPHGYLAQARDLANWHEYGVFSDASFDGIGNIAFLTMVPSVTTAITRIVNASDPLKLHYSAISYKPFLSLFNMTGVNANGALPEAIVNYAAAVVLEVRQPADQTAEPIVRFMFKNGTDDATLKQYPMQLDGSSLSLKSTDDVPISDFLAVFTPVGVSTGSQWCAVCEQPSLRGCSAFTVQSSTGVRIATDPVSPVAAGFIGAAVAIVVWALVFAVLAFLGYLKFNKKPAKLRKATRETSSSTHSITKESV